ncbi:MAG: hypothetical protein P1U63_12990 [Coxiellaceae bacterium]|nr:hypothetical protein [Coxiellaceae bacterium]
MSITAEEVATLSPGQFPFVENMLGSFDRCKQSLLDSPFHCLDEAKYFLDKDVGVMHNMLLAIETIERPIQQAFVLLLIQHCADSTKLKMTLDTMATQGFMLNDNQYKNVIYLHQLLHNAAIDDPSDPSRKAGSLVIHLEINPGNIFSRLTDPVTKKRLDKIQTGLTEVVTHLINNKLHYCIEGITAKITINSHSERPLPSTVETAIIAGLQKELGSINQCATINTQQKLRACAYRLHRAIKSLTENPLQYTSIPRSNELIRTTLQQSLDTLNQLIVPQEDMANGHEQYMRFLQTHAADDLPGSIELNKELEQYNAKQAHIAAVTACIDSALTTAKATNGFDTAIARAQYLFFEIDIFTFNPLLQLSPASEEAIYVVPEECNVSINKLNKHFRITPANGALYTKDGLDDLESNARKAGQVAQDPILRADINYRELDDKDVDCFEIDRLLNLQRLKNKPELCAQIKPELLRPEYLSQLANLPKKCFLNDSVNLLNLFSPSTITEQQIEYIGLLVEQYSVFNTYRILEHFNTHNINWNILCSIPKPFLEATIGEDDPVTALLQRVQSAHSAAHKAMQDCNAQMSYWDPRLFLQRATIQQQLNMHTKHFEYIEKILAALTPEPEVAHAAALA